MKEAIMMFGALPISVRVPPRMEAKARGNPKVLEAYPDRLAIRIAVGSIRPTAPTLFIKAERIELTAATLINCILKLFDLLAKL